MTRKRLQICGLLAVALPLLLLTGCPNTQFVENPIGNLSVGAAARPNDSGRYEIAQLGLSQLELRPADPEAAASLEGADPIGTLKGSPNLELNVAEQPLSALSLTAGSYSVDALVIFGFRLEDLNRPAVPQTCLENFAVLQQTIRLRVEDLDPSFRVSVPSQGGADLKIVVDTPGLIGALEANYVCSLSPSACSNFPGSPPAPCRAFQLGFTGADIAPFISVE